MDNNQEFLNAFLAPKQDELRAHFLRLGRLDGIGRGDRVWVCTFGPWVKATVGRKLPGNVFLAKLDRPVLGCGTVVVSCGVFGGKVAE